MALNIDAVQQAGDVNISVKLLYGRDKEFDLITFIGELNLFEDIYAQGLYGNIVIIDALNLSQTLDLTGDEYVTIKLETPSIQTPIHKTFKVYSITDKIMINDTGKQSFIMHFCSPEVFVDALSPVYKTFKKAKVHEHATKVFENNIAVNRVAGKQGYTSMIIADETANDIQFTSPGWRPGKILNWLASKAKSRSGKNPNYLYFESNKAFYFASIEKLISSIGNASASSKPLVFENYYVAASKWTQNAETNNGLIEDISRQYQKVINMRVIETYNALKNTQNGYLANRLYTFDVVNKKRIIHDYDHVFNWDSYSHLGKRPPFPLGSPESSGNLRAQAGFNQVYMQHDQLYTGVKNNVGEQAGETVTRRTSAMAELDNFKVEITVPGRTDIEIGLVVYLHYPDASPKDLSDKNTKKDDSLYSGLYLISAIRHQISLRSHVMILELVRDALKESR
jgi:hypothetical protein